MFDDTQVRGATINSKDDLDAFLKSLSKSDRPPYESAAGSIDNVLKSEGGQGTLCNEVIKSGESAKDIDVSFKKIAWDLNEALEAVTPVTQNTNGVLLRQLGETWQGHHETYIDLLWKSRRVAGHARAIATDFAEDYLSVLQGDYLIDDKKEEIAQYLKELEQDQKNSRELYDGFKCLREAVADFQKELKLEQDQTHSQELSNGLKWLRKAVETQVAMSYRDVSKSLEENLTGDIVAIHTKLGMFERVWVYVVSDITELEKHLGQTTTVKTKALFNKRIKTAATIYKTLARALYLYETNTHIGKSYTHFMVMTAIDDVVREVSKISPLVLIDVKSGCLCDGPERARIFKSEPEFKGLVYSTMTQGLDNGRIQQVVEAFFRYVTLSHVWQGNEPSFQDVNKAGSVWKLDSSLLNNKLRNFCDVVRTDGYRWAWSDTCCIDKTISTILNQSLKMMYKWYEASPATFVFLADVTGRGLKHSKWLTRAWTSQELLAPIVIRFYSRDWQPYLGNTQPNHKEVPEIMEELADAIGVARDIIAAFNPDSLGVREKLRLASTRKATVDEDIAYSLIGIFKSDIRPEYGEGYAALGHLLEEIVARSGEVTVLAWNGTSSSYNSCLPVSLEVYSQPPGPLPPITDTDMDERVAGLRNTLSQADAVLIHDRVTRLPPARFANRRLHLPCIIFTVRRLGVQGFGSLENHYRAKVSGIGDVEFWTSDKLPVAEPRKFIFVHPWIRELCGPHDGFTWGMTTDDDDDKSDSESESGSDAPASPLHAVPNAVMDDYTRALRLVVRLQQSFHTLLLEQQPNGEFKRVATEHEIVIPGIKRPYTFSKDVQTGVVEVL